LRILIYDDNPDFGGHQIMACYGVEALAADRSLSPVFMSNPANHRLHDRLSGIKEQTGNLKITESPCTTRKFQGIRNHFSGKDLQALEKVFQSLEPELLLCVQGEIEESSLAILAARRAGIRCVSYIPNPHTMKLMGAKLGGLRDRFNQYLFNKPDAYIAISNSMEKILRQRGVTVPIRVVPNGIDAETFVPVPKGEARKLFGLPDDKTIIGLIGRIEFNQKQQDFMVRTFCDHPAQFGGCHLVIAGDGPDAGRLGNLIAKCTRRNDITRLPWQDDAVRFYSALDFLLIPSRFEGVPLVMLEALCCGVPVLGSRRDGMQDILPKAWTFEAENAAALAETFAIACATWQDVMAAPRQKVINEMSLTAFKENFHRALIQPDKTENKG